MADIFVLKYLMKTLGGEDGAREWGVFKERQREGIDLAQADLPNQNLRGYDLSGANLSAAIFYNANLSQANFRGASLSYANLHRADLAEANLAQADLSGANLESTNAIKTNFEQARMCGCRLRGSHLAGAGFAGADLENADFRGANLKFADLSGAALAGASVEEAILIGCKIDEAAREQLRGLEHAILSEEQASRGQPKAPIARTSANGGPRTPEEAMAILQVTPGAERREIVKAYRKMVMQYHPDRVQHLGEKLRKMAEGEFQRVQAAYEMLTDESVAAKVQAEQQKASRDYSLHELLQLSKAHPNNDRVFYNLGRKFYEAGMLDRAIEAYEQAIRINPKNQYAAHNLKIAKLAQTLGKK